MASRNPFAHRQVISRRGGRVKQPLSRDVIVRAALDLLSKEGPEGMSLRKVAASLDTGPATLYAYVDDLVELQALVLDRALAGVAQERNPAHDWQRQLTKLLGSYFLLLSRTPGLAMLAMNTTAAGPNALELLEALLGILEAAKVDQATAAWAADLLTLCVTALAAEQAQRTKSADPVRPMVQAIGAVSAQEHPRVHTARELLLSGEGQARFTWAIEVLAKGILQAPTRSTGEAISFASATPGGRGPKRPTRTR